MNTLHMKAVTDLIRAVEYALRETAEVTVGDTHILELKRKKTPDGVFAWLANAVAATKRELNTTITVTPDETGLDNERPKQFAASLQQDIAVLGLTTMQQVEALCVIKFGQQGKVVGHGGHHVWVSEAGRNGRRLLCVTGVGPDWE